MPITTKECINWKGIAADKILQDAYSMEIKNRYDVLYNGNNGVQHNYDTFLSIISEATKMLPTLPRKVKKNWVK